MDPPASAENAERETENTVTDGATAAAPDRLDSAAFAADAEAAAAAVQNRDWAEAVTVVRGVERRLHPHRAVLGDQ